MAELRRPWQLVDYASHRGEVDHNNDDIEVLSYLPIIDCGLGDSPFGPPKELRQVLEASVGNGKMINAIWKYPPDRFTEVPTALIRERFGLSEKPTVVFNGQGSYGLLAQIILELPDLTTNEELGVLGIGPQFPNIAGLAEKHGKDPDGKLKFPYQSIKPSLYLPLAEKIFQLIQERKGYNGSKFIYIDNPNNPTGDFASIEVIENLVKLSREHNDIVIIDEAYGDIIPDDQSAVKLTEVYDNVIVIRGMAKIIGTAGARVGYGVFSREIGEIFQSLQLVFGVSGPQQLIVNEILKPEVLKPHIEWVKQQIRPLKQQLVDGLERLGLWIAPTHPDVPIMLVVGPDDFFRRLKKYQIVTERGSDFAVTYPLTDSAVRIRIPGTIDEVEEILARIKSAIHG